MADVSTFESLEQTAPPALTADPLSDDNHSSNYQGLVQGDDPRKHWAGSAGLSGGELNSTLPSIVPLSKGATSSKGTDPVVTSVEELFVHQRISGATVHAKAVHADTIATAELRADRMFVPPSAHVVRGVAGQTVIVSPSNCPSCDILCLAPLEGPIMVWLDDEQGVCINDRLIIKDVSHGHSHSHLIIIKATSAIEGIGADGRRNITRDGTGGYLMDTTGSAVTYVLARLHENAVTTYTWLLTAELIGERR